MKRNIIQFTGSTVQWIGHFGKVEQEIPMKESFQLIIDVLYKDALDFGEEVVLDLCCRIASSCMNCTTGAFNKEQLYEMYPEESPVVLDALVELFGDFYNDYVEKAEQQENKVNL